MNITKALFNKPRMGLRIFMVLSGQLIMGLGVAILKLAALGTDPYSSMMLALTALTPLDYGTFCALGNCAFFLIEILWGRKYIGLGTIANWFLLGYAVVLWSFILGHFIPVAPASLPLRILVAVVGVVILAFSLSLYQSADIGSSPYDSLPLILRDHLSVPFFAARIGLDACAMLVAFLAHGVLGLTTVFVVFGLGSVAGFFNRYFKL